ncbi:hypothetical protein OIU78_002465 [Salix suchowensis]|nr:hypothetical protein OIU78_002465 [Salix suchowensis]
MGQNGRRTREKRNSRSHGRWKYTSITSNFTPQFTNEILSITEISSILTKRTLFCLHFHGKPHQPFDRSKQTLLQTRIFKNKTNPHHKKKNYKDQTLKEYTWSSTSRSWLDLL